MILKKKIFSREDSYFFAKSIVFTIQGPLPSHGTLPAVNVHHFLVLSLQFQFLFAWRSFKIRRGPREIKGKFGEGSLQESYKYKTEFLIPWKIFRFWREDFSAQQTEKKLAGIFFNLFFFSSFLLIYYLVSFVIRSYLMNLVYFFYSVLNVGIIHYFLIWLLFILFFMMMLFELMCFFLVYVIFSLF